MVLSLALEAGYAQWGGDGYRQLVQLCQQC
jgi:hypothetical protein